MKTTFYFWAFIAASLLFSTVRAQQPDNEIIGLTPEQKITLSPAYQDLTLTLAKDAESKTAHLNPKQVETLIATLDKVPALLRESTQTQIYEPRKELLRLQIPEEKNLTVTYTYLQAGNRKIQFAIVENRQPFPVDISYPMAANLSRELKKCLKVVSEKPAAAPQSTPDPYSQNR